jgi:hypothetical protein
MDGDSQFGQNAASMPGPASPCRTTIVRESVNQANALLPAISNPRSGEIDRTARSVSLDSEQFSLAQSSRDAPG